MNNQNTPLKYVNLGCGPVFVDAANWLNLDFTASSSAVRRANLLNRLPLADESVNVVYTSHFLEHVPRGLVSGFLSECSRVLKPGGLIRLVLPDLENMAREYLAMRDKGEHVKADFVVYEMVDQCVRQIPGGELGKLYNKLRSSLNSDANAIPIIDYIRLRTGEDFSEVACGPGNNKSGNLRRLTSAVRNRISRYWINLCLLSLPSSFRTQNVSHASIGERHQWLWDFHQVKCELESLGFSGVKRFSANTSTLSDFPFFPLDVDKQGRPRKGTESMYVEALKQV